MNRKWAIVMAILRIGLPPACWGMLLFPSTEVFAQYSWGKVYEQRPGLGLSFLPVLPDLPNPFGYAPGIVHAPGSARFRLDNQGNILVNDMEQISILNPATHELKAVRSDVNGYPYLTRFWLGPHDEIYARLRKAGTGSIAPQYRVVRFLKEGNTYKRDNTFELAESGGPPIAMNFGPNGDIYVRTSSDMATHNKFASNGDFLGSVSSVTETSGGIKISLKYQQVNHEWVTLGVRIDDGRELFQIPGYCDIVKATYHNTIMLYDRLPDTIPLSDTLNLINFKILIYVVDCGTGENEVIDPYNDCVDRDFAYRTVAHVDFNYNGDIYASIIYFDEPGELTGKEKLVVYKWQTR